MVDEGPEEGNEKEYIYTYMHVYIYICIYIYVCVHIYICGPGNSVGIATDYELDGPGSNPGGDEIFRPFRPALGPTCKMGTSSFSGVKGGRDVLLTTHPLLVLRSWYSRAKPLHTL